MEKRMIAVLDTETAGGFGRPMVYDFGFAITDKNGNVFESRSFVIKEIFLNWKKMRTAYYKDKKPAYWRAIHEGTRKLVPFVVAVMEFKALCKKYGVNEIAAYNLNFDMRALKATEEELTGKDWFYNFLNGFQLHCIWGTACQTLYHKKFYNFCTENGFVSDKGNVQTSAEIGYRYLTQDTDFTECHTGLEDVLIEIAIMVRVYKAHKKMEKAPISAPWRMVQVYGA